LPSAGATQTTLDLISSYSKSEKLDNSKITNLLKGKSYKIKEKGNDFKYSSHNVS